MGAKNAKMSEEEQEEEEEESCILGVRMKYTISSTFITAIQYFVLIIKINYNSKSKST